MPDHLIRYNLETDKANARVAGTSAARRHYRRLVETVSAILRREAHPFALSDLAAEAIANGLPVDAGALWKDEKVLFDEANYICLCLPSLGALHGDARAYLADRLKKRPQDVMGTIPWNLALGGVAVNASGE